MSRGLLLLIAGVGFILLGKLIQIRDWGLYGWAMILGILLFGVGFLMMLYSLMRKVEYQGIIEDRAAEAEKQSEQNEN